MLQRLTINLTVLERQALEVMALNEMRDLRDQARFILRQEFERRGLLETEAAITEPNSEQKEEGENDAS